MGFAAGCDIQVAMDPDTVSLTARPDLPPIRLATGTAFGSGNHPTTRLCIRMLADHVKPGDRFLDVGTGTGILMIAAALLGADRVVGFDKHPRAAAAAAGNLRRNGIPPGRFALFAADRPCVHSARFDVAAVNILPEVIMRMVADVGVLLRPGGLVLLTGMIRGNTHGVRDRMAVAGLEHLETVSDGMWMGLVGRRCTNPGMIGSERSGTDGDAV